MAENKQFLNITSEELLEKDRWCQRNFFRVLCHRRIFGAVMKEHDERYIFLQRSIFWEFSTKKIDNLFPKK